MRRYTFYTLNMKNHIVGRDEHECASDLDAITKARSMNSDNAIEIWESRGRVGRIAAQDPLTKVHRTAA